MKRKLLPTIALVAVASLFALAQTKSFPSVRELMTPEEFKAAGLSKLSDKELQALDKWVQRHSQRVAQIVTQQAGNGSKDTISLDQLEGCTIVADDGEALGLISKNEFAATSISNQFGKHGGEFSATSIFNQFGKYGGEFSALSPFNEYTAKPPKIFSKEGKFVAFLTRNASKMPRVDPHALSAWLKSK